MKIFGSIVGLADFIPPIVGRLIRKARETVINPFDKVPRSVNVRWVLDVGANEGHVTLAALRSYPDAKVICFEPVKSTFDALTLALRGYKNRVVLLNQALSDANGEVEINITTAGGANSLSPQAPFHKALNPHVKEVGKEKVRIVRLDDIAAGLPAPEADVLKIDVEGHEMSVLRGGENFIKNKVDTILIEASFQRDSSWETQSFLGLFNLLEDWGFRLVNIYDVANTTNLASSGDMLVAQMDCVFRHKSRLKTP